MKTIEQISREHGAAAISNGKYIDDVIADALREHEKELGEIATPFVDTHWRCARNFTDGDIEVVTAHDARKLERSLVQLRREVEELKAILRENEWTEGEDAYSRTTYRCIECGEHYADKHTTDCRVAKVLGQETKQ